MNPPWRVDDIVAVADGRRRVELDPAVRERLVAARAALDHAAQGGQRIYGLNTGLGAKVGLDLADDPVEFQNMLLRGRAIGVGEPMPGRDVRAIMAARIAMLSAGGSGLSPHVFEALVALLDHDVLPIVPSTGSLGEGDLGLLAHMALVLIGEGEAICQGTRLPGAAALDRVGLTPVALGPKDGLSLINASAVAVGRACLLLAECRRLITWQMHATALSLAAASANRAILDPCIQAARPAPGQVEVAGELRRLLDGTCQPERSIQDPLAFRCVASVLGAQLAAERHAREQTELELGAAADNPVVLADGAVLSTGNFALPAFSLAHENLGLATAHAAQLGAARIIHLTNGTRLGLPRALSVQAATAAGFVPLQKTVSALLAQIRHAAQPVILDLLAVSEGVEDHGTQAPLVVAKTRTMLASWRRLIAIELLAAAQAVDLREGLALGAPLAGLHAAIRSLVPRLDQDRPLGPDAERLARWIEAAYPPE